MKRCLTLLLVCVMLLVGCSKADMDWQEQFDLGVRYLSEGDYEEAILAFSAAIEIDPKREDAYLLRGDAYIGAAQELASQSGKDNLEKIEDYLNKAKQDYDYAAELDSDRAGEIDDKLDTWDKAVEELAPHLNPDYIAQTRKDLDGMLAQLEYYAIMASLIDMGYEDAICEVADCDGDGKGELMIDSVGTHHTRMIYPMLADADADYFYALVGEYGYSYGFCNITISDVPNWGLFFNNQAKMCINRWNGTSWETWAGGKWNEPDSFFWGEEEHLSEDEFFEKPYDLLVFQLFSRPDLSLCRIGRNIQAVTYVLDQELPQHEGYLLSQRADFDGDGTVETIYFLQNIADLWFANLIAEDFYGNPTEPFFPVPPKVTAVVVSEYSGETAVRFMQFDGGAEDFSVNDRKLMVDGTEYAYQTEGVPFVRDDSAEWDEIENVYDILPSEFIFCSGVGAWNTVLNIESDGTFTGLYHDSDMGDMGPEYPNGTVYSCSFAVNSRRQRESVNIPTQ